MRADSTIQTTTPRLTSERATSETTQELASITLFSIVERIVFSVSGSMTRTIHYMTRLFWRILISLERVTSYSKEPSTTNSATGKLVPLETHQHWESAWDDFLIQSNKTSAFLTLPCAIRNFCPQSQWWEFWTSFVAKVPKTPKIAPEVCCQE